MPICRQRLTDSSDLAFGFARARCPDCGHGVLTAHPLRANVSSRSNLDAQGRLDFLPVIHLSEVYTVKYKVVLEESDEGFAVSVPGLPGCHSQGATEAEALENIADAIAEYLAVVDGLNQGKIVRQVEVAA